jgi:uncharacterized protein (TIGR03067 family)
MLTRLALALAAVTALPAFAPAPFPRPTRKPRFEGGLAALQGTWTVTRSRPGADGARIDYPPMKLKVDGTRWTFLRQVDGGWEPSVTYLLIVDDRHTPRRIDLVRQVMGNIVDTTQSTLEGIYAVEGDTVKILCVSIRGGVRRRATRLERPASFESPPPRATMYHLTRDK